MLVQNPILPLSSLSLSLRAFMVLMCLTYTYCCSPKVDLNYRGKQIAYICLSVLLCSITGNTDAGTGIQWREGQHAWRASGDPCCWMLLERKCRQVWGASSQTCQSRFDFMGAAVKSWCFAHHFRWNAQVLEFVQLVLASLSLWLGLQLITTLARENLIWACLPVLPSCLWQ